MKAVKVVRMVKGGGGDGKIDQGREEVGAVREIRP